MKILLFGITNVGKSTVGKLLSVRLNYEFDDLDDVIKSQYKTIDKFKEKYSNDYERHMQKGKILLDIVNKYEDNVVIAVSPIYYEEFFEDIIKEQNILAIELQDAPEEILKRLVFADENDRIYSLVIKTEKERKYYLKEIKEYYKRVYRKIANKFDMQGENADKVAKRLAEYIKRLELQISEISIFTNS